jgi:streptogramin lyase
MAGVFISYRRDDCAGHAGRLYDRLADRIGESSVFMDVDAIELGADFGVRIDEAIGACRLVIVLIGDDWLDIADSAGRRRLEDPTDFVRREVATALRRSDVRVIPVLVEGATMPPVERLPEDLKALARRNALELSDAGWRYDVERLIEAVERVVSPESSTTTPQAAAAKRPGSASRGGDTHASSGSQGGTPGEGAVSATEGRGGGSIARRPWALAGGALVLLAGILGAVLLSGRDDATHAPPVARRAATPPRQHAGTKVDSPIPFGSRPNSITFANDSVWVLSARSPDIAVLDAKTSRRIRPIPIGLGATAVAAGFDSVWVVKGNTRSLIRLNRTGDRDGPTQKIQAAGMPVAVVAGARAVWVGVRNGRDGTLVRVDRNDLTQQKPIPIPGGVQDIAVGKGAVWVTTISGNSVVRVDANDVANAKEIRVGKQPTGVAVGQGAIWVANSGSGSITPINPRTRRPGREVALEFSPTRIATGGGSVWATAKDANRLIRIDPRRRTVREEIPTGIQPYALDVTSGHAVWVTLLNGTGVQRVHFDP